jgi:DNA-binding SARP family transcriptional activator/Tfp pilus assembly protein PilF
MVEKHISTAHAPHSSSASGLIEQIRRIRYTDTPRAYLSAEAALKHAQQTSDVAMLLDSLNELAICSHVLNDYPKTIAWAELLLREAVRYGSSAHEGSAHNLLGIGHHDIGNLDIALEHLQAALALHHKDGRQSSIASLLHNIGNIYALKGEFEIALKWYLRALNLRQYASRELLPRLLNGLGYSYYQLGQHTEALHYLTQSLETAEADGFQFMQVTALESLVDVYMDYGDYTAALKFCISALVLAEQLGNQKEVASKKLRLGAIYLRMGDSSAAITAFAEALHIAEQLGAALIKIVALSKLGEVYAELEEYEHARAHFLKAKSLAQTCGYAFSDAQVSLELAKLFMKQRQYSAALPLLNEGLLASQQAVSKVLEQQYHEVLATLYKSLSNLTLSLQHTKLAESLQAQISAHGTTRHLLMEFETRRFFRDQRSSSKSDVETSLHLARKAIEQKYEHFLVRRPFQQDALLLAPTKSRSIFVKTFGEFVVTINGRTVTKSDWQRKKARDIFKILLIHHQKAVTTDELIDLLWNDTTKHNVEQVIKNSISFIRRVIEPDLAPREPSTFLRNEGKAYILDLGDGASIDFLEFKSLIHQASKGTDRVALYKKAIALYTGDFLKEDLYAEWSVFERESLKDSYLYALTYLAQHALAHEDEAEAVSYARQLIDTDRTDDKGYEILLRIFLKQGNHSEARRIYAQCKEAFAKELGSAPPMHLHALVSHLQ